MTTPRQPAASMAGQMLRGAALLVALRFAVRAVGLISIVTLARLLTPADFGVVGTAAIVLGLFTILQHIGLLEGLIRLREIDGTHVRTAWTVGVLMSSAVTGGILLATPFAADFLQEQKLRAVLPWLAFTPLINSLASPGSVLLLRDMQFGREFKLRVLQKILAVGATVTLSFITRDYWGLVYGTIVGALLSVTVSYLIYPYKPVPTLSRLREFAAFSSWTLLQSIAIYVGQAIDEIVIKRISSTQVFGLYHTSRDLSRILISEFVAPATFALLPGLARLRDDRPRFAAGAERAIGVGAIVAFACGIGVSWTSVEITALVLGPQWGGAAPFLAVAAIAVAALTLSELHRGILAALDRQHWSALLWVARAAVLTLACTVAGSVGPALLVARSYAVASVTMTLVEYLIVFTMLGHPRAVPAILFRPLLAGLAMAGLLSVLPMPPGWPVIAIAIVKVAAGAGAYVAVLAGLWLLMGRPQGAEMALLQRLPARFTTRLLR